MSDPKKPWVVFGEEDALPCPNCKSTDLEFLANVVACDGCGHRGPYQDGPEIVCDWRIAIDEWNVAAGGKAWAA